jgi:hypothetical protein
MKRITGEIARAPSAIHFKAIRARFAVDEPGVGENGVAIVVPFSRVLSKPVVRPDEFQLR